jgi:hypothetical protein
MELPTWAFKAESRVRNSGAIDMVFSLRPLGRVWMIWCALVDLVRTTTITITIEFQGPRPIVKHEGETIEPSLVYELEDPEIEELVKRVPKSKLMRLIELAQDRLIESSFQ